MSSPTGTPSAPGFKAGHASSHEPSPASTFGGSASSNAGDDDFPQTPMDEGVLLNKLSKLSVNDGQATGRYSPPFVRNGSQSTVDDPFTSPQHRSGQRTPTGPKSKGRSSKSDNWRSGSSTGSGSGQVSPSGSRNIGGAQVRHGVYVQEYASDDGKLATNEVFIKPEDAQAVFPPSSCVFVANLLQSENDEALEVAVTQVFREYGTVYVKIRRDPKQMPFAFCQYTNDADAERAIKDGRGRLIKGRPCRCEKAKAHRLFLIERRYGAALTPSEARDLLRSFGNIIFCRHISPLERSMYSLHDGVMVQFEMYDEGQAAQQAFRNHPEFKMQCMANMATSPSRGSVSKSNPADRSYLETYEVDKRSIFVGNLPADVTEDELFAVFSQSGDIIRITLHKNESTIDANKMHCFAFVEYKNQPCVSRALSSGATLRGDHIRVMQKDTESAKARTRRQTQTSRVTASSTPSGSYQSPAVRSVGQPQASPMAHLSPGYPYSPLGYAQGGQPYGYQGTGFPGQPQYSPGYPQMSPFSYSTPPYFAYTGSPSYGATSAAATAGSPTQAQYYFNGYGYSQFPSPAPYFPGSSPVQPMTYWTYPPTNTDIPEDRSATPTPAGYSAGDNSLESE